MKTFAFILIIVISSITAKAQKGEIQGRVVDITNEPVPFVNISVERNGYIITGGTSDHNGFYSIKVDPGEYTVKFSSLNFHILPIEKVKVTAGDIRFLDVSMIASSVVIDTLFFVAPILPVDVGEVAPGSKIDALTLEHRGTKNINDGVASTPGVYQSDSGAPAQTLSTRIGGTAYYLDDMRLAFAIDLPIQAIQEIKVNLTGISAKYGDMMGGVVAITTASY